MTPISGWFKRLNINNLTSKIEYSSQLLLLLWTFEDISEQIYVHEYMNMNIFSVIYSDSTHCTECRTCVVLVSPSLSQFYQSRALNDDLRPSLRRNGLCTRVNSLRVCFMCVCVCALFQASSSLSSSTVGCCRKHQVQKPNTHLNTQRKLKDKWRLNEWPIRRSDCSPASPHLCHYFLPLNFFFQRLLNHIFFLVFTIFNFPFNIVCILISRPAQTHVHAAQYEMTWNIKLSESLIIKLEKYSQY